LVIPPWRRAEPLEYSEGISPTNAASWRGEAREVAEFGDDGDRDEPLHAAQRLQGLHDRIEAPRGRTVKQFGLEPREAVDLFIDGAHGLLKDDLLGRRRTDHLREIPAMRVVPVGPTDIVQAEPEQEAFQPELRILQGEPCGVAGPTQIADRFILDVGTYTRVRSPDRSNRASSTASRRSVFTLSPGFLGMSDGATTWQAKPLPVR
jgi:hypothetical protein